MNIPHRPTRRHERRDIFRKIFGSPTRPHAPHVARVHALATRSTCSARVVFFAGLAGLVLRWPDSGRTPADFQTHYSPSFFTHFLRILYQIEALRVYYHVGLVLGPKNYEISPCKNQGFGQTWNLRSRRPKFSNERPRASLGPPKAHHKLEISWNTTFYVRMNSTSKMEVRDLCEIEGFTS